MEQSANHAAVSDAQIKLGEEECAFDMGQRSNDVVLMGAQGISYKEECA